MERRKLTKEDIDKVRDIEGFPIGTDEDIIALSDAPYYTACPNPFIEDFIKEYGTPYDEETDDYHCEPFAADVSEGKGDSLYGLHSYHTKVPHKAIMRYIMHYTKPGDVIFDGFCGTGMTGLAAQVCESVNEEARYEIESNLSEEKLEWGHRYAILNDLSPAATFIAANYNGAINSIGNFSENCEAILRECEEKYGWMYKTRHIETLSSQLDFFNESKELIGDINYVLWSDVFICPHCGEEFVFWELSVDEEKKETRKTLRCKKCGFEFKKTESERYKEVYYDNLLEKNIEISKQVPVLINYTFKGQKFDKVPDEYDLNVLQKINDMTLETYVPVIKLPDGYNTEQPKRSHGFEYVHQFYTKRNLIVISFVLEQSQKLAQDERLALMAAVKSSLSYGTKMVKVNVSRMLNGGGIFALGAVTGTLYIPSNSAERPILHAIENKVKAIIKNNIFIPQNGYTIINTGSLCHVPNIPEDCVDYIFTDPPFGDNLNYSELNFLWEAWQKVYTNNEEEAIVNPVQNKKVVDYQRLMEICFKEYYRLLKPNRWITVEFHNSKNAVWNAIQEALQKAGFVIADVRTLDKKQKSFMQANNNNAVKQDLIISAYKPGRQLQRVFDKTQGDEISVWAFVNQHLSKLPIVVDANKDGAIDVLPERQAFLLFDRMVAYHIMQGIPVPMDAADFYKGLDEHFVKRDSMYFLPDQVNEYDTARIKMDVEPVQMSLLVTNEKTAIAWLYKELETPQTYATLQPKFMQEAKTTDKYELIPELSVLLEENFIQNDKGEWYIPDVTKEADVNKLREKRLWKEFEGYLNSKGKLKLFRSEAIRVGFARLWKEQNYKAIVEVAERLPEKVVQEDANILMYYDISTSRV